MVARKLIAPLAVFASLAFSAHTHAAVIAANPTNYRTLLDGLQPGDTLQLASGTYTQGLPLDAKTGTASAPIVIRGPDDQSAVFTARDCCNTVQLDATSYVQVVNLTLDGLHKDGPFGVDARNNSHHITLENLKIVNHDGSQQTVGISTKGTAWNWVIRRNTIIGAGTGIYLGSSDGSWPFVAGLIEYNVILDTIGYNMEIKHQIARPTGTGLPTGDSRTIIRHNVFSKTSATVGSDGARPNLLVGHFPLSGAGANDLYEIYGNFFYQNPTEALFQGEGNIALHDNVFVNSAGDAANIQAHEDKPRTVTVYHNTVVAAGGGLHISGADTNFVQKLIGNASFAATPLAGPNQQSNITGTYAQAATYLNAPYAAIGSLDLYPKTSQLTGTALDLTSFSGFTDGTKDFNGTARTGTHRGAYEGDGTNSGWRLALSTKPAVGGSTPTITMSADPTTVSLQGSTTLQWAATDATSCTASDGWTGARPVSGSETVGPLAKTTTFTMTCTGAGGSIAKSATVTVAAANATTVTISASPMSINAGETALLSWTSTNAAGCSASNGWTGSKAASGTQTVGPLQANTTFQLDCFGTDQASATVTVTVGSGGGGTTPPPTTPPTTPPPATPPTTPPTTPPQSSAASSGGGGGSLDLSALVILTLLACRAATAARAAARRSRAG